jgi:hypothetical protein
MSFALRNSLRAVSRRPASTRVTHRTFATEHAALQKYMEADKALAHHAAGECDPSGHKISLDFFPQRPLISGEKLGETQPYSYGWLI